ncbi:aldo/keto reductase [Viridibacillus sp. YIM B01967]|uniref:Aldo/keto reductase n=1 Tax=Viridibacillus soli TaxID=2798301 RepID=A0ABS1H3R8_9BACL|nr:aldo/keto reductase [Viridibacillus soli]MBK3493941.1 aldo/keto reductase [Viridibacillus soli]
MNYTTIEKQGISISTIGFGTNAVGGHNLYENLNEEEGKELVRVALNNGVTLIDTADAYGPGRSEELVGEVLQSFPRDQYILATKGARTLNDQGELSINNSPAYLRSACEASLRRLGLDYIDIYYIHFPELGASLEFAVAELVKLKQEGKIRAIGISNVTLEQLKEANSTGDIDVVQLEYNMLNRNIETEILPYCIDHQIAVVAYGPLAFGILGGKYTKELKLDAGDWRNSVDLFKEGNLEANLSKVEKLKEIAAKKDTTVGNLAIAWLLAQKGITAVIPGGKNTNQILENFKASEVTLTAKDLAEIEEII